jgi:DNA-binding response OmpR family regulator
MSEKVLIVDDEEDFLEIMSERMRTQGMDMDFMMPAIDGFQALKLIKEKKPEVQIILLTGNVPEQKRIEAKRLGALDVIEKPADLKVLIRKIKNAKAQKKIRGKKSLRRK